MYFIKIITWQWLVEARKDNDEDIKPEDGIFFPIFQRDYMCMKNNNNNNNKKKGTLIIVSL